MVIGYVGTRKVLTGSGKTLSALCKLKKYIESTVNHKYRYNIVSNISFSFKFSKLEWHWKIFRYRIRVYEYRAEVIDNKEDFIKAMCSRKNTIFFVDEAGVWFNQYDWKNIPDEVYDRLNQIRKDNIHFIYTSQKFKYVVPRLRDATNPVVECSPFPKADIESFAPPPTPIKIQQSFRTPEYFEKEDACIGNKDLTNNYTYKVKNIWYAELKRTFPTYDTKQKVHDSGSNLEKIHEENTKMIVPQESIFDVPPIELPTKL